jgi:VCBS repeat-containing protein
MSSLLNLKNGTADNSDFKQVFDVASGDGAITIPTRGRKHVFITKATAAALTLAAPTATAHDGVEIVIVSTTAAAHTVTVSTTGMNDLGTSADVGTFGASKGNGLTLVAYQGDWYVTSNIGVTLA